MGFIDNLSTGLMAFGTGLQGGNPNTIIDAQRAKVESAERKRKIASLMDGMGIAGNRRALLDMMPVQNQMELLYGQQQKSADDARRASASQGFMGQFFPQTTPFVPAPEGTALGNDAMAALGKPQNGPNVAAELIKGFEGYRDTPYWDVNALRTGYGSDTITNPDGSVRPVQAGDSVTQGQADMDLQRRIDTEFVPIVKNAVGEGAYNQMDANQRAALTSIAYNYGKIPETVAAAARSGDMQATAQAIAGLAGHNGGVNAGRRAQEAQIFGGNAPQQNQHQARMLQLSEAANNPDLTEGQRAWAQTLLDQEMASQQPMSPMDQVKLEQARLDLEQDRNSTPDRPVIKGADGFNYYKDTGERVLPGVEATARPTSGQQDYQFYAEQERAAGREPQSFNDWRLSGKRAGAASVTTNVDAGGPTKGWEAVDKAFATDVFVPWSLQGGSSDSEKLINQLAEASGALGSGAELTGPATGNIPDIVQAWVNPDAIAVRERVEEVVQRNLKDILGAQFTENEGARLIARAYNPKLEESENKRRVDALIRQMTSAADAKTAAVEYFSENGTMRGFEGKLMTARDFEFPEWDQDTPNDGAPTVTIEQVNQFDSKGYNDYMQGLSQEDVAKMQADNPELLNALIARGEAIGSE